jgi:hypothetical protein
MIMFTRQKKCKIVLVDVMDCQVHALFVKLGWVKETPKKTIEVNISIILIDNDTTKVHEIYLHD